MRKVTTRILKYDDAGRVVFDQMIEEDEQNGPFYPNEVPDNVIPFPTPDDADA